MPNSGAPLQNRRHCRFTHQRMPRHTVDHIALPTEPQHFLATCALHFSELLRLLVDVIKLCTATDAGNPSNVGCRAVRT